MWCQTPLVAALEHAVGRRHRDAVARHGEFVRASQRCNQAVASNPAATSIAIAGQRIGARADALLVWPVAVGDLQLSGSASTAMPPVLAVGRDPDELNQPPASCCRRVRLRARRCGPANWQLSVRLRPT